MSNPSSPEGANRSERLLPQPGDIWILLQGWWQQNPGYCVAAASGILGLLLALWLLLSSFLLAVTRSAPKTTERDETGLDVEYQELTTRLSQGDLRGPTPALRINMQVRSAAAVAQWTPHSGVPLEPEFAPLMPTPKLPVREPDLELTDDHEVASNEFARFNRARAAESLGPLIDSDEPLPAVPLNEIEAEEDLRLAGAPLLPDFAEAGDLATMAFTGPADAERPIEPESSQPEVVELPVVAPVAAPQWRAAAPLPPNEYFLTPVASEPLPTRFVTAPAEPASPPTRSTATAAREPPRAQLSVRWLAPNSAAPGKLAELTMLVSNTGNAPAWDVTLQLDLPEGVEHKEGRRLIQSLGKLNPDETRRIPLFIRPLTAGEISLPVEARTGDVRARSTGFVTVAATRPDLVN